MSRIGFASRVARGAVAGLVATAAMSAQMMAPPSTDRIGTPPPRRLADVLLPREPQRERRVAAAVLHLGIGVAGGVAYRSLIARRHSGPVSGALFGLVIWFVGYEIVVPALGALPPAHRDEAARRAALIEAHALYGAILGALG